MAITGDGGRRGWAAATVALVAAAVVAAGCARTSRIDDEELSVRRLMKEGRAIALMRIGAASAKCLHAAVLIGVEAEPGYRRERTLSVRNVRGLSTVPVAEAELDAGTYHVIGYGCTNDKGTKTITDEAGGGIPMIGGAIYRTSYARFTLAPGEIVNVGYLHFHAEGDGDSLFGRAIKTVVAVSDWPIDELERFARQRPAVYALMRTRLMETVSPPPGPTTTAQACTTWRTLSAQGKVQVVPAGC
jgi:hypothetical protein